MQKLAIISTHPIQYNAPFFRILAERKKIEIKVFYTWSQSKEGIKYDPGFGKNIEWDIPLLEGYNYTFVENIAPNPGSHHFAGIQNPNLIKEIKNWGAEAVLVYGWNFKSHLATLRYFKNKIPVFFRGDSTLINEKLNLKKLLRRVILHYVYRFVDVAFYAGLANKLYFKAHGLNNGQLALMPHAVDNIRFRGNKNTMLAAKKLRFKSEIPIEALVFLFAGKLDNNKNVCLLIEAFIKLQNSNNYLLVAGTGSEETKLKNMAMNQPNIKFLGFLNQAQIPVAYAAADVFVLPSKSETWGLSINEAMAAGKAIVVSSSCGAAFDLLKDKKNGLVFQNNNLESITNCLKFMSENRDACLKMGIDSEAIIQQYTYQHCCEVVENTLNNFHLT